MTRKNKNRLGLLAIIFITISSIIIALGLVFNVKNDPNQSAQSIQFDWIEVTCSLLSGAASVILGVVAIVQGEKANKLSEELAAIDRMQFENATVTSGLPLIKFKKTLTLNTSARTLDLDFSDEKDISIKNLKIWDAHLYPFSDDYKSHEEHESIMLQKEGREKRAEMLSRGNYRFSLHVSPADLLKYPRFCLEFELGAVNSKELAAIYRFKLLVRTEKSPRKKTHFRVFHQFYEIVETMGEDKLKERLD